MVTFITSCMWVHARQSIAGASLATNECALGAHMDDLFTDTTALQAAIYQMVHAYGTDKLADEWGMTRNAVSNKANPGFTGAQLGVLEFVTTTLRSGDLRPFYELARLLHHVAIPFIDSPNTSDVELLECFARLAKEFGDLGKKWLEIDEDHLYTFGEVDEMDREVDELTAAGKELVARIRSLAEAQAEANARRAVANG